jgi:hypothetical protein
MMVWIVLSLALSVCLGLYCAAPLFETSAADLADGSGTSTEGSVRLLDAKERALRAIKDLELDFAMGKVSKDDYDRSYAELSGEVGRIISELSRHE